VGGDPSAVSWAAWSAILLGNWWVTLHGFAGGPMGVLWSISVEEQFYLFAPWAIKCFSRWSLRAFGLVLIVTANAWLFFLGRVRVPELAIWTNSFVQFENFAAGLLLCLALRDRSIRIPVWTRFLLLATCATFWYYACKGLKVLPRWTIYLGRISYGLYVFHLLSNQIVGSVFPHHSSFGGITMIIKGTCGLGLTILLASLSYRYFETPFLRMKKRHEVIESRPI
jgi:peptidoglycan/LPS O-acetylase OafA/YrhL